MTYGEDSIKLPDGEELVMIEREDWLAATPGLDPREASLNLRRQAVQPPRAQPAAVATP